MNKCKKCGTEFEGKFCPECGEKWQEQPRDEKICPHCGSPVNVSAKFCPECGYSLAGEKSPAADGQKPVEKPAEARLAPQPVTAYPSNALYTVFRVVKYLPTLLFLLMSVLAFAFLAAPVTKITSAGQFLGVIDFGNAYQAVSLSGANGIEKLRDPAIAFLVFAALGLAFAFVCALLARKKKESAPLAFGALAFYLVYLIIGSVMIANTAALDEGLGVLGAGACPVCFLVFSIVFALFHIVSLFFCKSLRNREEVIEAEKRAKQAEEERLKAFYATHKKPVLRKNPSRKDVARFNCMVRYYNEGKAKTPSEVHVFVSAYKVLFIIAAFVLIIAIVLMATLIPYFNNKFRAGVAEDIALGDSKEQVADVLGEPYGGDRTLNDWFYYDGELLSYAEKAQDLTKKQEQALAQGNFTRAEQLAQEAKNLQEQMKSKAFKCIEVTFAEDKAESVLLDMHYSFESQAKEAESYELLGDVLVGNYVDETVSPTKYQAVEGAHTAAPYEVRFTDGSYYKTYAKNGTLTSEGIFSWNDKYGNYSEKTAKQEAVMVGTVDKDGVWTADSEGIEKLNLSEFILPDSVTSIGDRAFMACSGLTSVTIPDSVTSIGRSAFSGCSGLTSVTIGSGVTSIGQEAFSGCSGLTRVDITDLAAWCKIDFGNAYANPLSYAHHLYLDGEEVTTLTIPNDVTEIQYNAFSYCDGLTSVTIPDSVTSIEQYAFWSCTKLTDIRFKGTVKEWQTIEKDRWWDLFTGDYTVTCTDGTVDKYGSVTYF